MWIIGDGGSPERAPSDTLESCVLAVSEWADGVLVRLWSTGDNRIVLAPRPILPAEGGEIDLEKSTREECESRPPISPLTGKPYRLTGLEEFLRFLSLTPVRGFLEPSAKLLSSPAGEIFREALSSNNARLPLHVVLPPDLPLPSPGKTVSYWRRSGDHFPSRAADGASWILDSNLFNGTPGPDLPRFLINGNVPPDRWPFLRRLQGFWGVLTPTPYFTRKTLETKGTAI